MHVCTSCEFGLLRMRVCDESMCLPGVHAWMEVSLTSAPSLTECLQIDMVQSAMAAAAILVLGGWVDAKKAIHVIEWDLLLLIGSMLGIPKVRASNDA